MKKCIILAIASSLLAVLPAVQAGDITGKITLKGTAPIEKDVPQIKDDPNCGKLHTAPQTTHHYVVGPNGELANVVVSITGKPGSTGASAPPIVLDQKGCEYTP